MQYATIPPRTTLRIHEAPAPSIDGILAIVTRKLDGLFKMPLTVERLEKAYDAIHDGIAALPLTTDEFGYLKCRLGHALNYCRQNTPGAAKYELRLVMRRLMALP